MKIEAHAIFDDRHQEVEIIRRGLSSWRVLQRHPGRIGQLESLGFKADNLHAIPNWIDEKCESLNPRRLRILAATIRHLVEALEEEARWNYAGEDGTNHRQELVLREARLLQAEGAKEALDVVERAMAKIDRVERLIADLESGIHSSDPARTI